MKSKLICCIFALLALRTYAQETETEATNVVKVTFLNPGVAYEAKIGKFQTVYAQLFMNTSSFARTDDYNDEVNIKFYFDPAATLQLRHYYNARKREDKERRTAMNSMNFIALVGETIISKIPLSQDDLEEDKRRAINQVGFCWGMQRNNEGRFSFDLYLGLGYRFSTNTRYNPMIGREQAGNVSTLAVIAQLNIGLWLNKKPD